MGSRLLAKHTKLRMYTKFRLQNSRIWFHRAVTPTRLWLAVAGWSQSPGNRGPAGSAAAMMASEPFGTNGLREQPRGFRNRNFRI